VSTHLFPAYVSCGILGAAASFRRWHARRP
jgi:hypothetical protein